MKPPCFRISVHLLNRVERDRLSKYRKKMMRRPFSAMWTKLVLLEEVVVDHPRHVGSPAIRRGGHSEEQAQGYSVDWRRWSACAETGSP